ncbi:MAG: S-methyl-5'-thioinosine phosphorylase [Methylococcales bacterium]|nr:S-methyl-5'-thioinosine phosphorylase [Methylococcales bacterium]
MSKLAIIGGTGLSQIKGLKITQSQSIETPFGSPSAEFICGNINEQDIIFLARHGNPHHIAPHKINYRANIWGLKKLGVTEIIAVAAVGGITSAMEPAHIALPDQIIDYSYSREHTFFADDLEEVTHIDFTFPYTPQLRQRLIKAAEKLSLNITSTATYGCTQGPRLESAAEITRMERDGCDLVGMTGMPEAALARELNIDYASVAVVANWAAGKSDGEITMSEIEHHLKSGMSNTLKLLSAFLSNQFE